MSLQQPLEGISDQAPDYSLGLHIAGILIIFAASTLGVFMPLIAARNPTPSSHTHPLRINMRIPSLALALGKQFGAGIILATAFIHTLPTAMSNLSSSRLGPIFSENYQAFGGLITLGSSLFMHWIEFMVTEYNQQGMQETATERVIPTDKGQNVKMDLGSLGAIGIAAAPCLDHTVTIVEDAICRRSSCSSVSSCSLDHDASGEQAPLVLGKSPTSYASTDNTVLVRTDKDSPVMESLAVTRQQSSFPNNNTDRHHHHLLEIRHSHGLELLDNTQRRISTYILEAGVAAHSVIIGVTLGVTLDAEFTGLLIALVFHQFFEGFALGARIADLEFKRTMTHYLLALIFALTVPVGTVLGIAIASSYSKDSAVALLTEGILDAISTGILLYMGYVNLLAVEFNLNGKIREGNAQVKSLCFIALWTGAGTMAFIETSKGATTMTAAESKSMSDDGNDQFSPLDWTEFFETKRYVAIPSELDDSAITFCIYETNRGQTNLPVVVLHHGAGHCALSFAATAKELQKLIGDQVRILCYDVRGHGETTSDDQLNLLLDRLARDLHNILVTLYGPSMEPTMPKLFLVGHSMGGSVVTEFATRAMIPNIRGIAVLDMMESYKTVALANVKLWCEQRPQKCDTLQQVIRWGVESGTVRNVQSARVSFPGMVTCSASQPSTYTWRTDLLASESFWSTWFDNQNQKFLAVAPKKLLILAAHGQLDDEMKAALEQEKYQFSIFTKSGHAVQEDEPEKTAYELVTFWNNLKDSSP
ncbi:hypothetical protein BGZ50_008364 [Haplosporangium sp. Z 11]|nr:hypothetical protein BGZ50_008364 [Haplosporangium sp. Z 11]